MNGSSSEDAGSATGDKNPGACEQPSGERHQEANAFLLRDRRLVERVSAGDPGAIEELFLSCAGAIKYIAAEYKHSDTELLSDLFWHLRENDWRRLKSWKAKGSLKRWLYAVASRICSGHVKEKSSFVPLEDMENILTVPDRTNGWVAVVDALEAIEKLETPRERLVMRKVLEEKEPMTIAGELGISRGNVDTITSRARKKLAQVER